jgi:hypothetical protein
MTYRAVGMKCRPGGGGRFGGGLHESRSVSEVRFVTATSGPYGPIPPTNCQQVIKKA